MDVVRCFLPLSRHENAMLFVALPTVVTGLVAMSAGGAPKTAVMINGLPGAMGREIAAACLRRGVELVPFGLTGPDCGGELSVDDGSGGSPTTVKLYESDGADEVAARLAADYPHAVCIDFTLPVAVNPNAEWYAKHDPNPNPNPVLIPNPNPHPRLMRPCRYAKHGLPFVMGTTGGDREALTPTLTLP
jgi:4-hydroxy-tetrahydrodipicolinate reductase